ncbi:Hypothetical Protein FCC1311_099082 [Hondaea fermentalgiana]|uniref:Uncharacterized protein n=1 Tax=Hondaea fermentalgiana TaxID=2315210 RepID=A0A2R5GSW8_9STRA|nr:Hypothetical Protein FCC1311_099082 [Hondaea fermentalgiana]|eukprot:GBG33685.1 Hypothetical Protein FCC1311_099082 [Hondaea fermentalgiana]
MTYTPDDNLSASQLRQRYKSMPDDEMSASQLRAKNGIPSNKFKPEPAFEFNIMYVFVALFLIVAGGLTLQIA